MLKEKFTAAILFLIICLTVTVTAAAQSPDVGQDYIVQADDWLSKLSDKFYGDILAYPAIVEATNSKAATDSSYTVIDNPDLIEIGQKVYIPSAEEASAILQQDVVAVEPAASEGRLVVYSGRSESLVGPLLEQFEQDTGIQVEVRYGDTAEMAATILEEGNNSPADVFYGQDAGALGALANAGRFTPLPEETLNKVDAPFRSNSGEWVGASGRARVVVYNPNNVAEADLPDDIFGFCDPQWAGRIGWPPTNGSFQAFVTALRVVEGEDRAREWLQCIQANEPKVYPNNTTIVAAVADGEIDVGYVNHYYLFRFLAEDPDFPARNYSPRGGDTGAMINVAGVGILNTGVNQAEAQIFVDYLLRQSAQEYFNRETHEYPLSAAVETNPLLTPISELNVPNIDLNQLEDLDGTLQLLAELGIL